MKDLTPELTNGFFLGDDWGMNEVAGKSSGRFCILSSHPREWEDSSWRGTQAVLVEDGPNDDNPGVRKEQKHLLLSSMGCSDRAQVLMLGCIYRRFQL